MPVEVVKSPTPALVTRVAVEPGKRVNDGEPLVFLSVMKTEYTVTAPKPGVVKEVYVKEGDEVDVGTPLLAIEVL